MCWSESQQNSHGDPTVKTKLRRKRQFPRMHTRNTMKKCRVTWKDASQVYRLTHLLRLGRLVDWAKHQKSLGTRRKMAPNNSLPAKVLDFCRVLWFAFFVFIFVFRFFSLSLQSLFVAFERNYFRSLLSFALIERIEWTSNLFVVQFRSSDLH